MPKVKADIGKVVRRLRLELGLSQHALAERAQCNRSQVTRIERAENATSLDTLQDIARALGVSLTLLVAEAELGRMGRVEALASQHRVSESTIRRWLAGDTDAAIVRHTELVAERAACHANGIGARTRASRRYRGLSGGPVAAPLRCT